MSCKDCMAKARQKEIDDVYELGYSAGRNDAFWQRMTEIENPDFFDNLPWYLAALFFACFTVTALVLTS